MDIVFDTAKDEANIAKHGISLRAAAIVLHGPHSIEIDDRYDYSEERLIAAGNIGGRVYVCCFTMRGETYRIISLRKANRREINDYRKG